MIQDILGYAIGIFVYSPLNLLIHECGHAFFIKVFGGNIKKIYIGIGDSKFSCGKIVINKYFFLFGLADFDSDTLKINNKFSNFLIAFGGVLFNVISLVIVILIFNRFDSAHYLKGYYIGFTTMLILSALTPVTYPNGTDSDGKHLFRLLFK